MKNILFVVMLTLISTFCLAQNFEKDRPVHDAPLDQLSPLQIMEDSLVYFADSMSNSPIPEFRVQGGYAFIGKMKQMLKTDRTFEHPFNKLDSSISIVYAPDKKFRIFTWELFHSNTEARYYGVVQMNDGSFIPLIDVSDQIIRGAEDSTFSNMRWYGCLYYKVMQKKIGEQDVYFLFGWNGNSINGDKKLVEAFGFDNRGRAIFGAPIFNVIDNRKSKRTKRFILNYKKDSRVSLNYDESKQMIIFDHCESQVGDVTKKFTYVPDGTYDGLKWTGTSWDMFLNVIEIADPNNGAIPGIEPLPSGR